MKAKSVSTNWQHRDQKHLWHPLTQHKTHPNTLPIKSARGVHLYDYDGNAYIDGISSWYTCVYGHCHPKITQAVAEQMQTLDQVVFSGFTHEPAIKMSEALFELLPTNQAKVFFSDNGSTSVEVALKMALQFHFNQENKKNVILALDEGFHGDTFGAMSASGLSVYNGPFEDFFIQVERIKLPSKIYDQDYFNLLEKRLSQGDVAAFIYEPLVQGAAGMKMHEPTQICQVLRLMKQYDVVTIADEVMTGFGKTGTHFASEQISIVPDIMCLSKALTAGLLPMGLTTCSQKIYNAFYADEMAKGFFHGHTYSANPLACTAALAGMELLQSEEIQGNLTKIMGWHEEFIKELNKHPNVINARSLGVILAFELQLNTSRYGKTRDELFQFFMREGIFLRPLGNTLYVLPPYVISYEEMQRIYQVLLQAVNHFKN